MLLRGCVSVGEGGLGGTLLGFNFPPCLLDVNLKQVNLSASVFSSVSRRQ